MRLCPSAEVKEVRNLCLIEILGLLLVIRSIFYCVCVAINTIEDCMRDVSNVVRNNDSLL